MKRKVLAIFMVAAMVTGILTGCGSKSENSASNGSNAAVEENIGGSEESTGRTLPGGLVVPEGKTTSITIQMDADIESLNPWAVRSTSVALFQRNVYERLFDYNNDQEIVPFMVKSYEWVGDGTLKCEIYDHIHDSEGNPFTTSDIIFSIEQAAAGGGYTSNANMIDLEKTQIVDDYNIIFAFSSEPNVLTLENFTSLAMVTEAGYNNSPDGLITTTCGTGTYIADSYTAGIELTLSPNENYWMTEEDVTDGAILYNQNVDKIYYKIIPDETQRTIEFDSGTIDVLWNSPSASLLEYRENPEVSLFETVNSQVYLLFFNHHEDSLMSNPDIRMAVAYAIDNETINKGVYEGLKVTADQFASAFVQEYEDGKVGAGYEYDIEKSKEYLAKAGYPDGGLQLTCIYSSGYATICEVVQSMLAEVGITLQLKEVEDAEITSFRNTNTTDWDLNITRSVQKCGTVMFCFYNQLGAYANGNGSYYTNAEYDVALKEGIITGDVETAREACDIVMNEAALYAFCYDVNWHVTKPGIENPTTCSECVFPGNWEYTTEATWLID